MRLLRGARATWIYGMFRTAELRAELARVLTRPQPPLLIDVSASDNAMLPGALHFVHGGLAFRDIPTENAYEQRFLAMLRAYQQVFPMSADEVPFLPEVYRFFILNYVVREGARFFRPDLCTKFRSDAVRTYLPALDRLDTSPLRSTAP
jgi:hypothetical protein